MKNTILGRWPSPQDSTRLASASWDSTVKIWDVSSGACLHTLEVRKILDNILLTLPALIFKLKSGPSL